MNAQGTIVSRFELADCALCGARERAELYRFDFDSEIAAIVQCSKCRLVYSSPRPTPDSLGSFYGSNYYSFGAPALPDAAAPPSTKEKLRRAILVRHLAYPDALDTGSKAPHSMTAILGRFMALPRFVPNGRLLDVGCGSGERMLEFQSFGWQVAGLEFSDEAAKASQSVGLDIRTGSIESTDFAPESFDCITFYHSLEHVYDPATSLAAAHRLLKPGGQLLVAVPNFGSSERRIFGRNWGWLQMPTHLFHFSKQTLGQFVTKAGFAEVEIRPSFHGYSVDGAIFGAVRKPVELLLKFYALAAAIMGDGKALTLTAVKG
ncbi:MAG: class I SAM-dependent methyltransferase [Pontixanthobacter sp.]